MLFRLKAHLILTPAFFLIVYWMLSISESRIFVIKTSIDLLAIGLSATVVTSYLVTHYFSYLHHEKK